MVGAHLVCNCQTKPPRHPQGNANIVRLRLLENTRMTWVGGVNRRLTLRMVGTQDMAPKNHRETNVICRCRKLGQETILARSTLVPKKNWQKKQPISNGLQHWAKKPSLQPLLRRKNRQTGLPQIFGAQNMEHKVGWTCIKKILSQLHFLGWPRVPTESKGISLISSSAKGISPRSRLLQDFCTKVWGEERCKILCPAADRKKCFRIPKKRVQNRSEEKISQKGSKKYLLLESKTWFHPETVLYSVMCILCPLKGSKKNIQVHFRGVQNVATFPPRDLSSMMRGSEGSTWRLKKQLPFIAVWPTSF